MNEGEILLTIGFRHSEITMPFEKNYLAILSRFLDPKAVCVDGTHGHCDSREAVGE